MGSTPRPRNCERRALPADLHPHSMVFKTHGRLFAGAGAAKPHGHRTLRLKELGPDAHRGVGQKLLVPAMMDRTLSSSYCSRVCRCAATEQELLLTLEIPRCPGFAGLSRGAASFLEDAALR